MSLHPESEYAFWTVPGTPFTVYYWLSLFHEIDFQVNEGFRRIPHGGIEIGGLLFGHIEEDSAHIEAFRAIDCEHSKGPSFVLSEHDLGVLREQIAAAGSDPELRNFQLLGWFVAHTRSQLEVNNTEAAVFDQLFPAAKLMLLVKPERFRPTRFLFLARDRDGKLIGGPAENAVMLPLPGRTDRGSQGPIPSLLAPPMKAPPPSPPVESVQAANAPAREAEIEEMEPEPTPAPLPVEKTASQPGSELPLGSAAFSPTQPPSAPASRLPGSTHAAQNLPPIEEIRRRRSEAIAKPHPSEAKPVDQQITRPTALPKRPNPRLAIVLFIAAALGCAVGYTIYLQLPPVVIPLNVQKHAPALIVTWPPEQTRDAVYAALRVDDGDPIPLSPQQKSQGQAAIPLNNGNMKIELIAQHWMRDSRGILRYVEPLAAPPAPSSAAPSQ